MRAPLVLVLAAACALTACTSRSAPNAPAVTDLGPPALRLPAVASPVRYQATLDLAPGAETFAGQIAIELELAERAPIVWLNAADLSIDAAAAIAGGVRVPGRVVAGTTDVVGIGFSRPLGPGPVRLELGYRGTVDRKDGNGVFAEQEAGDWYLFTQFEPIDARRAFPCFDEPRWKVPWQLSLRVPADQVALSNTPILAEEPLADGRKLVRFAETKPLPSYLIAFAVGPFDIVEAGASRTGVPIRIVTQRGRGADEAAYAAEVTPQILALLEDYFDIPYPYAKLDTITLPTTQGFGAMEHPGLVTFAGRIVLWKPEDDSSERRQRFASTQAHELAHQWFGNLVTMPWWDDIWLNEAFASWTEARVLDAWQPSWELGEEAAGARMWAMRADSLASARRIREPIASNDDVENAFDGITYSKGEAVLRMFEHWLGADVWQAGIRSYLRKHALGSATADEFVAAMSATSGRDLARPFASFLEQTGVPLIAFELECGAATPVVRVSQRRFVPLGTEAPAEQAWQVPVCVRYGAAAESGRACALVTESTAAIPLAGAATCPQWIAPNADGRGYYHALLSPPLLARALAAGDTLAVAERVALLGDLDALARANQVSAAALLTAIANGGADPSRHVVELAASIAAQVDPLLPDRAQRDAYGRFVREVFGPRVRALGLDRRPQDTEAERRLRPALIGLVGVDGHDPELGAAASAATRRWIADPKAVAPELVSPLLSVAAAHGDRDLFEAMRDALLASDRRFDQSRLLSALGGFTDPALLGEGFALVLDGRLDPRLAFEVVSSAAATETGREAAWRFTVANLAALEARLSTAQLSRLASVAAGFCDEAHRGEAESALRELATRVTGGARNLRQALERIDQCIALREAQAPAVSRFLGER
jgi:alanyl aminopeptidase